jgi:hypothetical protein
MKRFIMERLARIRSLPSAAVQRAEEVFNVTGTLLYQSMVVLLTSGLLLGIAIFIYGSFYYAFVPLPIHRGPVHLIFEPCQEEMRKCGFLNASINLSERNPILMTGTLTFECLTFYMHFSEL